MKTSKELIGILTASMSIVCLLSLAAWSLYGAFHVAQDPVKPVMTGAPVAPASDVPAGTDVLQELQRRVARLEKSQNVPETIARVASSSVALIVGEYIWLDRT